MADISDVENALVGVITSAVYPNGTGGASAIGAPARIYRGWPNAAALDKDLAAGIVNITVFPQAGMTRNTTRYPLVWQTQIAQPTPTITVTSTYNTVTFAGVPGQGNLCGVRANRLAYAYAAQPTDTPAVIAAALAASIPGAQVSGATITLDAPDLLGRVVAYGGTLIQETRRQWQAFLITFWAPSPELRDTSVSIVDSNMAPIEFITLADGMGGRLIYRNSFVNDVPTKDALWRRDLTYAVEYPTTRVQVAAEMLWGLGSISVMAPIAPGQVEIASVQWEPS